MFYLDSVKWVSAMLKCWLLQGNLPTNWGSILVGVCCAGTVQEHADIDLQVSQAQKPLWDGLQPRLGVG